MYKAILLDLNSTLSKNWRSLGVGRHTSEDKIRSIEQYRAWLADWLHGVDSKVYIFTVRPARTQEATLETISKRLSWTPDGAYFNDTPYTGNDADKVKSILLDRLMDETGLKPEDLYAFESNSQARAMYNRQGVNCRPIRKHSDLPPVSWFRKTALGADL